MYSGGGVVSQDGQNDLPQHQFIEETKLWRLQELGFTPRIGHQTKMVFIHEDKRRIDFKTHHFPE